jgi:hypothetical protein
MAHGRETGSGKPALRQALQARGPDLDLISGLPSGPAAWNAPQQRPNTCQHPTTGHTALEDFSCSLEGRPHMSQSSGVHGSLGMAADFAPLVSEGPMVLNALVEKLKRRAKDDSHGGDPVNLA